MGVTGHNEHSKPPDRRSVCLAIQQASDCRSRSPSRGCPHRTLTLTKRSTSLVSEWRARVPSAGIATLALEAETETLNRIGSKTQARQRTDGLITVKLSLGRATARAFLLAFLERVSFLIFPSITLLFLMSKLNHAAWPASQLGQLPAYPTTSLTAR